MFQESLVGSGRAARNRWSFAVSLLAQTMAICLVLLATMAYTPLLPAAGFAAVFLTPPPPPPGPPPPPPEQVAVVQQQRFTNELRQPAEIPNEVAVLVDPDDFQPTISSPNVSVIGAGPIDGIGVSNSLPLVGPPPAPRPQVKPAPKPPEPAAPSEPTRVGGDVQAAKLIRRVAPVYPDLAVKTRTQGTVRLRAVIAADGAVEQLTVIGGHPLLIRAAVDAVKQWRYRPTFLNGKPTTVITEIEVNFVLK